METVRVACRAMATRFEIMLQGNDPVRLRAAGEEALAEVQRLEAQLSFYRPTSELSRINATAAQRPVRVDARMFRLLQQCAALHHATQGAFDPTVAPLMRCWGFVNDSGRLPTDEAIAEAIQSTGMEHVILNEQARTVAFAKSGISLDFGGIGKGFALDEVVWILEDLGIERAFIHGGTSTMYAFGTPFDAECWQIVLPYPGDIDQDEPVAIVGLKNEALSVSAVDGKAFEVDGRVYGHVIDPRTGWPVDGALMTAIAATSATATDALSTALLVASSESASIMQSVDPESRAMLVFPAAQHNMFDVHQRQISVIPDAKRINRALEI